MNEVYLSLGSNVGDRFIQIVKALLKLDKLKETRVLEISSFYKTEPYGYKNQNEFINLVARIETNYEPEEFHSLIKSIEIELGRKSRERWSEREIDIDILFFGSEIIQTDNLTIPHSDLHNRKFVLEPLNEIGSDLVHPIFKKKICTLIKDLKDESYVKKLT